jgi:hypothetical protein
VPKKRVYFVDMEKNKDLDVYLRFVDVKFFVGHNQLLGHVRKCKDKINVVYLEPGKWGEFLSRLPKRSSLEWISIFFDEIEDIFPEFASKEYWQMCKQLADSLKYYGQTLTNLIAATQQHTSLNWMIRDKMMYRIYLRGSKVEAHSRLKQYAIDNLKVGEAYICGCEFQKFRFSRIYNPNRRWLKAYFRRKSSEK